MMYRGSRTGPADPVLAGPLSWPKIEDMNEIDFLLVHGTEAVRAMC